MVRLRRSDPQAPGLRRIRRGRGFSFTDVDGSAADPETRARALSLAIPPAWRDVWICPWPNGHIQAIGTDAAGRRQYLYHPEWHRSRAVEKHSRVLDLARRLPELRREIGHRLAQPGLGPERVGAVALRMLDAGLFRTGGEEYEEDNGSHGVATLLREHVTVSGDVLTFSFPAKSGQDRVASMQDRVLAQAVRSLRRGRGPGEHLLQYRDGTGWHDLTSSEINAQFRQIVGPDHSVKDLRTWAATVLAAAGFAEHAGREGTGEHLSNRARAAIERDVMRLVAEHLGNTPAVARGSYVDGRIIDEYAAGRTIARTLAKASAADRRRLLDGNLQEVRDRERIERAVARLLA
jgi:DNA topoisomerase IB